MLLASCGIWQQSNRRHHPMLLSGETWMQIINIHVMLPVKVAMFKSLDQPTKPYNEMN